MAASRRPVLWSWRKGSPVQHVAITGRGSQLATYCNRYWVQGHVRPAWADPSEVANPERRPCLLCVGWLTRNNPDSWRPLIHWMASQAAVNQPRRAAARHLEAV